MNFGQFLRIELDQFGFVLDVDEDTSLSIGDGKFRFAT